ncbi:MAG: putative secreted protein with C-terminal beta-propeller domain [Oceanicoccus sp.]|jgi:uncharacterized secreted protein with C-terminal beta-propeller domain
MMLKKLATCMALVMSTVACMDNGANEDDGGEIQLISVKSGSQFKQSLIQPYLTLSDYQDLPEVDETSVNSTNFDSEPASFSGTNLQVEGVDEADVWKYDGNNFFILNPAKWQYQNTLTASCVEMQPCDPTWVAVPGSIRVVKNTQETLATISLGEQSGSDLYLNDDQLIMVNQGQAYNGFMDIMIEPYFGHADSKARIRSWDVSDVSAPKDLHDIEIDGYIQRTRRIGDELYIVSRFTPRIEGLTNYPATEQDIESNTSLLSDINIDELLPKIRINGQEKSLVNIDECLVVKTPKKHSYDVSVTTITRLNTKTNTFNSRCVSGPVDGIYMSENNLYLYANSFYSFETQADDSITWNWSKGNSHIHQFALAAGKFDYKGSALLQGVSGGSDANFRFGELEDGTLAVVTSTNEWANPEHLLSVLKSDGSKLNTLSQLPNELRPQAIGKPGERIYSVRFMQNRAYIVTFQKVDPLYAIDLSDPSDPKIAGELEIPGFSEYLHPIGDDLLVGIGKGAVTGVSGTTWFQGIKIALFDVSDMSSPTELDVIDIGQRGSNTALAYDHHAFTGLTQGDDYRFALPISVNDNTPTGDYWKDPESAYYDWSYTGLHLFDVKNKKLSLQGALITQSHDSETTENHWTTKRGLIQGNDVYHLSGSDIYKANWLTPDDISDKF